MASSRRLFPGSLSGRDGRRQAGHTAGADRSCELCGRRQVIETSPALGVLCGRCLASYAEPMAAAARELRDEGRL